MPKKKSNLVVVQTIVSIPRAGEFKVGIPIDLDWFVANAQPPSRIELENLVSDEVLNRLRVKLDKGEHKRFVKAAKR